MIREMMSDPLMQDYDIIMLDEAHERNINTDLLLGMLKKIVQERSESINPLKLIVMSATLEIKKF